MLNQNAKKNQVNQEKPLKRFGQNFLIDKTIISTIVSQLKIKPTDTIVEIGPGHGELTHELLAVSFQLLEEDKKGVKIIAIEKDPRLIINLKQLTINHKNLEIIEGDALRILPELSYKLTAISYKLVGNIPYYITGHLLRILGELENKPEIIVLTIQKEVAERIVARPPKTNLLSASVQFWGKPEIIQTIGKEKFNPVPKVDSAIIRITPLQATSYKLQADFYKLIKVLFKQPRKTIWNNLKQGLRIMNSELSEEELKQKLMRIGINPNNRPQNLNIDDIKKLVNIIDFASR